MYCFDAWLHYGNRKGKELIQHPALLLPPPPWPENKVKIFTTCHSSIQSNGGGGVEKHWGFLVHRRSEPANQIASKPRSRSKYISSNSINIFNSHCLLKRKFLTLNKAKSTFYKQYFVGFWRAFIIFHKCIPMMLAPCIHITMIMSTEATFGASVPGRVSFGAKGHRLPPPGLSGPRRNFQPPSLLQQSRILLQTSLLFRCFLDYL